MQDDRIGSVQYHFRAHRTPMLKPEHIRVDTGRCDGGSVVRVTHLPTGISRTRAPLRGSSPREVTQHFLREIEAELVDRGLADYVVSDQSSQE